MKNFLLTFGILTLLSIQPAIAFEPEITDPIQKSIIEIQNPYAFATMPGATIGAAFMVLKNVGELDDKLIGAHSKIAEITEIHQNIIDPNDGKMMMRKIKEIDISIDESAVLEPKGYHVMFIKMKEALIMGENVDITLIFEKAGEIKTTASIVAPGLKPKIEKTMPWSSENKAKPSADEETSTEEEATPEILEKRTDY